MAIFGRLLEMSEKCQIDEEEKDPEPPASETKPAVEEKRTTRGASRKKE